MADMKRVRRGAFRTSEEDLLVTKKIPLTPQTRSPAYRLAFNDLDFLCREELRPVRLQLELLKPELLLSEHGIQSTVVIFGGARIPAPGETPTGKPKRVTQKLKAKSRYYREARKFAKLVSETSIAHNGRDYVVVSGGGPGIMEAANRGAHDAGAASIGMNIVLPEEQAPNEYVSPELSFQFHYFGIRKMHFLLRARAVACFPGGFGTLDEMFECLTLIQTGREDPMPFVLFGKAFRKRIINFEALAEEGTISRSDLKLFSFVEKAEDGWEIIRRHYGL